MSKSKEKYIDPQKHLSVANLIAYKEGKMDDAEMHRVEQHALDCELCSEALEGILPLGSEALNSSLEDLKGRFSDRLDKEGQSTDYWKWGIAASVLLLFSASIFFILNNFLQTNTDLAKNENGRELQNLEPIPLEEEAVKELEKPKISMNFPVKESARESIPSKTKQEDKDEQPMESRQQPSNPVDVISTSPEEAENMEELIIEDIIFEEVEKEERKSADQFALNESAHNRRKASKAQQFDNEQTTTQSLTIKEVSTLNSPGDTSEKAITGKVVDEAGEALPGVNVMVKGSTKGTITDINGEYALSLPPLDTALVFSFIGFNSKEIRMEDTANHLLAVLEPDVTSLSEVVVVGYSSQKKRDVTGAVLSVPKNSPATPVEGNRKFRQYLKNNMNYPEEARKSNIEGNVIVAFFVETDGSLSNFRVVQSKGYGLDEEAIRLVKEGPEWKPATSGDQKMRKEVMLKIPFKLK